MAFSIRTNRSKQFSFKINPLSSGISISIGIPGVTVGFTINDRHKKSNSPPSLATPLGQVQYIKSSPMVFDYPKEYKLMVTKIRRLITFNNLSNWFILSLILTPLPQFIDIAPFLLTIVSGIICILGFFIKIYVHGLGRIKLDYEDKIISSDSHMLLWNKLAKLQQLWQVISITKVKDEKSNGGYPNVYNRLSIKPKYKKPFYLDTNASIIQLPLQDMKLIILPDLYLVVSKSKIGLIKSSDIKITLDSVKCPETDRIPEDASILEYTWKYVNRDGSPDKRYKDNKKLPICQYGVINITSENGLDVMLLTSQVLN